MSGLRTLAAWLVTLVGLAACQTSPAELGGLADQPPLDYAVFVTGGGYLAAGDPALGTFAGAGPEVAGVAEPIDTPAVVAVLAEGRVFQSTIGDQDPARRRAVVVGGESGPGLAAALQAAREAGCDLALVLEELHDGPIEAQGVNGRWPVTFLTWILLGVGAAIPDHTFESRATLRITLRDVHTGRVLHDPVLASAPVDLALLERSDVWGLLLSILVPPFWVGDDRATVQATVRDLVRRRLLVQLARDLKSESVRQRLRDRSVAGVAVELDDGVAELQVVTNASLSAVRLRSRRLLDDDVAAAFERSLLGSQRRDGDRSYYRARLPAGLGGSELQVLVATIRGEVTSATFVVPEGR